MGKAFLGYFIIMWVRSTLPRIRIDHMLAFNWKFLTPLTLSLLIMTAIVDKIFSETALRVPALLTGNVVIFIITIVILRETSRRQQKTRKKFKRRPVAKAPVAGKAS
jgi:NADH-quinone oxidoreductase subunit H